ncbi:MAG: nucleotide exchange factor GrpE, partial [Candidatus Thermochlorobacter sp.]
MPEETKQGELKQEQEDISLQEQPSQQNADDATAVQAKTETPSLEARLAALEAERDEYKDLLLRKAAEFENFRRQK